MLGEDDRFFRFLHLGFSGVIGIVEADGNEFLRTDDGHPHALLALDQRQLVGLQPSQSGQALGRQDIGRDVVDNAGQITDAIDWRFCIVLPSAAQVMKGAVERDALLG